MLNAFFVFLSLLIVLMVGGAAVVGLSFHGPIFETSGPDYERYVRILELSNRDAGEEPAREPVVLDLAELNGGNWEHACLYGGEVNPVQDMRARGARIAEGWRSRNDFPSPILAELGEYEEMIAFIDSANLAHFIRFGAGNGVSFKKCISKPETTMRF